MLTLQIDSVYTRLVGADLEAIHLVSKALAVEVVGAQYTAWYRSGRWDGQHRFLERPSNRFFTGLLPKVRATLIGAGMAFQEADYRSMPEGREFSWKGPTLRPYQDRAARTARKAMRGIISLGTGGGKTVIAGRLIADLGLPTLFLVHRKELADQAYDRFREYFGRSASLGRIGGGQWNLATPDVCVGMIQSLHQQLKQNTRQVERELATRAVVLVDEAHRVGAASYERVLRRCPAYYRYGLSGTPLVDNDVRDLTLIGLTGPVIVDVSAAELAEKGWLAQPVCTFLTHSSQVDWSRPFKPAYEEGIVRATERNGLIEQVIARHPAEQILFIVRRIAHGSILAAVLKGQVPFVSGQEPDDARRRIYEMFRVGGLKRLIASTIYDEGVDFPNLDVVVNLAGGKTIVPLFQRLGRAMHRADPTKSVWFYDFADMANKHLRRHYKTRRAELIQAGFEVRDE